MLVINSNRFVFNTYLVEKREMVKITKLILVSNKTNYNIAHAT